MKRFFSKWDLTPSMKFLGNGDENDSKHVKVFVDVFAPQFLTYHTN